VTICFGETPTDKGNKIIWKIFVQFTTGFYFCRQPKLLKMKKTFLLTLLIVCSHFAFSQYDNDDEQTFKFGLGTALSLPVSDLKESSSYGIGFEAIGVYSISDNIAAFAQAGVHVFDNKNDFYGDASGVLHVPLMLGARFKAGGFFAGAGIGYGMWSYDGGSSNGFLYSPQIGYDFGHYQFMLNYTSTSVSGGSLPYFGLKAYRTF